MRTMQTAELVEAFLMHLKGRNVRPKTYLWYVDLRHFSRRCPDLPLAPEPIECFLGELSHSDETKYAYWRRVKALYRFAEKRYRMFDVKAGDLPNPMASVDPPLRLQKVAPTLDELELRRLVAAATTQRDREMVLLAIDNGMREGSIAGLQRGQIGANYIKVSSKGREAYIPISEDRRRGLMKLLESQNGQGRYVFLSNKGGPLTPNGVYQVFRRLMAKAGVCGPKLGPHRVRHAVGRGMLLQGADLVTVQNTLGHANIVSTRRYANLLPPDVVKLHARYTLSKVVERAVQGLLWEEEVLREAEVIIAEGEGT